MDDMTLEQVRDLCKSRAQQYGYWAIQKEYGSMANAIDAAIKQREQDAVFAPPETEEDVMAYLHFARLHIKRFRELLQDAMAKESGND